MAVQYFTWGCNIIVCQGWPSADLGLPTVRVCLLSVTVVFSCVLLLYYLHSYRALNLPSKSLSRPIDLGHWMTSKTPPKTAQLCEGVQTSPYSGFMCRRASIKDCIPFPTFTPKIRMFAGGRKE